MIYRIYKRINYSDTIRDPDDICVTELGYKQKLKDAIEIAEEYIKEHFINSNTKLHKNEDGSYGALDFCSYGAYIEIQPINLVN
jgi:hypothetical protein